MNTEDSFQPDSSDELAQRIAYLINGYIGGDLTVSEHQELDDWVSASINNQLLFEELTDPVNIKKWIDWKDRLDTAGALERVKSKLGFEKEIRLSSRIRFWSYWIAAAAVLAAIFLGDYWFQKRRTAVPNETVVQTDLPPGGKHAVLTLGNGNRVLLDTVGSEKIGFESKIWNNKDSAILFYGATEKMSPSPILNILSTPVGGEYEVQLSDGTRVWLNASSSLKYPESFTDSVRKVELTGKGTSK